MTQNGIKETTLKTSTDQVSVSIEQRYLPSPACQRERSSLRSGTRTATYLVTQVGFERSSLGVTHSTTIPPVKKQIGKTVRYKHTLLASVKCVKCPKNANALLKIKLARNQNMNAITFALTGSSFYPKVRTSTYWWKVTTRATRPQGRRQQISYFLKIRRVSPKLVNTTQSYKNTFVAQNYLKNRYLYQVAEDDSPR